MSYRLLVPVLCLAFAASCKKGVSDYQLQGEMPDPGASMVAKSPYLFTVLRVFSCDRSDAARCLDGVDVIVAQDGNYKRWTFVAAPALKLMTHDVITVKQVCYRAWEDPASTTSPTRIDACTDIVSRYAAPTAEAPAPAAPPPAPPVPVGSDALPPDAAPSTP